MFQLDVKNTGDVLYLIPMGEMDMYFTPQFKEEALDAYHKNTKNIVIDAKELNYLDSTGLGGFIYLMNAVKDNGHHISIVNLQENVKKLFTITKLDQLFDIKGEA